MKNLAPYQLFFPLGLLNAILAVGVWLVQNLGWFETPAILIHSKLIVGGFLWSFIVGFLMTAVPRMTGAQSANKFEYVIASILMLGQTLFSWKVDARFFYANQMSLVFFLLIFGIRRVIVMTKPLPVFFSHVGIAMMLALFGTYYHFIGNFMMGIHLYHVGTILLLVLGIGTRFFSFLSGLNSVFENTISIWLKGLFHSAGALMGTMLFFAGNGIVNAYLGISILSVGYLIVIWRVERASDRPSPLKYGVRIVAAMIPLSFFLVWLQPSMFLTWLHLLFIGCFSLITFSVATRVVLAHGAYPTELELKSPGLWWMTSLIMFAAVFRLFYSFATDIWKINCLYLAVGFWICAVAIWSWTFLPRIFKHGPQEKPSC